MRKTLTKALALLLALAMVLSLLPVISLAVEEGDAVTFISGLPADDSYGVIYNAGGFVMGADFGSGQAPALEATATTDGKGLEGLPRGTAVVHFIQSGDDYYLVIGGKYVCATEDRKLTLSDTVVTGAKWTFVADQAGLAGYWNIKNAEVQSGGSDIYLEQYQGRQFSPYYYKSSTPDLFQMRIAATDADEDGRVGDVLDPGSVPEDGKTYVVYNHAGKSVLGQPKWMGDEMRGLLASPATLNEEQRLSYDDISDGGLIFTVTVGSTDGTTWYAFENNGLYLAMPENYTDENGEVNNEEYIYLIPEPAEEEKLGYIHWTLEQISGGYVMYNVAARYGSSKCCIEFYDEQFSGWSFKPKEADIFAMNFFEVEDRDGCGYVSNPTVAFDNIRPAIGADCVVNFTLNDASDVTEVKAEYFCSTIDENGQQVNSPTRVSAVELVGKQGSFTIPSEELVGYRMLAVHVSAANVLGKAYDAAYACDIVDEPQILSVTPLPSSATGEEQQPEISVAVGNLGVWNQAPLPDNVDVIERFTDVSQGWYTEAVDYVVELGLMSGISDTEFGRKSNVTREQFVNILWRMDGSPEPTIETHPFTDLKPDGYAYKSILWAYETGITAGKTETTFGRKLDVSRQEIAVFFQRYAAYRGFDTGERADLSAFPDNGKISKFAKDAMQWAVAIGIISGSGGELKPRDPATRAEIASMMMRFDKKYNRRLEEDLEGVTYEMLLDGEPVEAQFEDGRIFYVPAEPLEDGKHTVKVTITRADGKTVVKEWFFYVGDSGEALYFGQVHSHTSEYSDGAGALEDAYEHAHGAENVDFMIVTDHSNYFDTSKTATTSSYYDLSSLLKTADNSMTKWEEARATAKAYNELYEDLICLYGYEMTWSGGPGHTNTFNTYGVVSRNNSALNNKTSYAGMHLYNDLMSNAEHGLNVDGAEAVTTRDGAEVTGVNATKYIPFDEEGNAVPVVSQFNHPGVTFGNFGNFAGYTSKRDDVLNLVEVGNGEGKVGGSAYFPSYAEYDRALSMGWHVAPTNNQDNHKGGWGDSNTCRDVILTDDFSEIGVYRALDARRVYATEDQNLEIYYELEVGGVTYKLGDIAALEADEQPETVKVKLTVNDPDAGDAIAKIQIIGEGARVVHEIPVNDSYWKGEFELPNSEGFYYVKVVEADGAIAVTAPVWTKEAIPVTADLETSASVAAQGEEETVIAKLTNGSESETLFFHGYKVEAEGRVLAEAEGLEGAVEPGTSEVLNIPFTPAPTDPPAKKTYEITVTFYVVYKGKELSYTKTITETSYPPEMMTYVALDRGHKNFYVSGDYANCEGPFLQICADRGIICKYLEEGEMTAENLAKYKAVFLTVPRINEATQPPVWTQEELDALAEYAANGGSILNFCKSDRYDYAELVEGQDTYNYASATLSNLVNEAVGAKTRVVRGIVVDNERKENAAYRVYFNGRNLVGEHPFTEGIYLTTNGKYQWYNGTGITIEEGADVTTLISPYATTWVADYDGSDTFDYANDPVMADMGTFSLVTCEPLSGGGFLVCAGATFISSYDLKTDDPASMQYENYMLVCNILDYIKEGPFEGEITPIAEVHNGEVGEEYTVEGVITSNASDYDKDTAFFDCIYVQDETRGINCFPVSGYYFIGEQVRVHGGVTYYCGEIELNLGVDYNGSIKVISNDLAPVEPMEVSCAEAMADENIGNLMKVTGMITEIHETSGIIDRIYVDDGSGEQAMFFINAYIQKDSTALANAEVGMMIEGIGIGSRDVDDDAGGADGQVGDVDPSLYLKRLRVRSRDELIVYAAELDSSILEDAIAAAQAIDRSLYTEDSLAALDEALDAALAVLNDPNKTQKDIVLAANALNAAIAALEELQQLGGFYGNRTVIVGGDKIVIYHPTSGKALGDTLNGNKIPGVAVTADHGELTPADGTAILTVQYPEGDTVNFYLKTADGKYLTSAPTGNGMSLEATPNEYSLWYLQVKDEDAGTVFVRSTNAVYGTGDSAKPQALEFYKDNFTTYGWADNAQFIFQLYVFIPD